MAIRLAFIFFQLTLTSLLMAQNTSTHALFTKTGKKVKYAKMIKSLNKADLIFVGESHNNPISHWIEMKVFKSLHATQTVILGLEMFETDTQEALDAFMKGDMEQEEFLEKTRAWNNYTTDYSGIIAYAKTNGIKVVASNIPRRYASMVYKRGMESVESLVAEEKRWIAPLPIPYDGSLPGYVKMQGMFEGHGGENFPKSQAIKDATMAHSIVTNWPDSGKFIHMNGSYHSDNFEGILWYVEQYRPGTKMATITTVVQENIESVDVEHLGKADFILVVDADVTTSY